MAVRTAVVSSERFRVSPTEKSRVSLSLSCLVILTVTSGSETVVSGSFLNQDHISGNLLEKLIGGE